MAVYDVELVRRIPASSGTPALVSVAGIKTTATKWTRTVGEPDTMDVTCTVDSVDRVAAAALLDLSVTPCELWLRRDGILVAAGPVTSYEIRGRTLTIHAAGIAYYLRYMLQDADYNASADLATHVAALVNRWQALAFGHYGLDTAAMTATGVTQSLILKGTEARTVDTIIAELGQQTPGFDLEADSESRRLVLYSPRKGSDLSASVFIDARSIANPSYSQSVTAGYFASEADGVANINGIATLATASNTSVRSTFGRAAIAGAIRGPDVSGTLTAHATRLLDVYDGPLHAVQPDLLPVPEFTYGSFNTGDLITYSYDAGLGLQTLVVRVKTIMVDTSTGTERLSLTFL